MQHLTHQSKVWLTAKPNLPLIKGISFILSFSTRKKKIPVIAETIVVIVGKPALGVTKLTYHLIRTKSTAPQMVIIYELTRLQSNLS